jgi:Ice-binding-like
MNRNQLAAIAVVSVLAVLTLSATLGALASAPVLGGSPSAAPTSFALVTASSAGPTPAACGQAMVPLGAAGHFRVLAGTTVTNTGATVVHGNVGVSPGSAVTGFPPGKVTGKIDKANTAAANGQLALVTAYNNAMGRTHCPTSVAGNIGGKTLGPGLYKSTSSLSISSGDLTLTAHGHPGAVFIFQVQTKFTTTAGRKVILAGGAQASHIFWAVGSSATLGTTSVLYGTILAHKSISMATGAVLHGRALAHIGAVTFGASHVDHAPFLGPQATALPSAIPVARPSA